MSGPLKNNPSTTEILGEMVWLYSMSNIHRMFAISSIHLWLIPALESKQFRIYHKGKKPVGLVTWAWMSREAERSYVQNTDSLRPEDWSSGDRLWALDFIAPFGDARRIAKDLKHNVFPNDVGRFLRVKKNSDTMRTINVHGVNVLRKSEDSM